MMDMTGKKHQPMSALVSALVDSATETTERRVCPDCGDTFQATCFRIGTQAMWTRCCEACESTTSKAMDARAPLPRKVRDLDTSWPARHVEGLARYTGPALAKAKAMWETHIRCDGAMVVLYGPRGRGKTGMATWWAWRRGQDGLTPGTYATAYELFARIRRSWHPSSKEAEWDALRPYMRAPYLVIDQLHQCRALASDDNGKAALWERMALAELIDHRYRESLPTVLIATVDSMDHLSQAIDPDILARVGEAGGVVHCNWTNYRAGMA